MLRPLLKSARWAGIPLIRQAAMAPTVLLQRLSLVFLKAEIVARSYPLRPIQSITFGLSSFTELSKRYQAMAL